MQSTIDSTSEAVAQAKGDFERFSARLLHLFTFVPDDKLDRTPSPTSRSPLRIVAHCAVTSRFFADLINGEFPESMPAPDQFVKELYEAEAKVTTREEAIALVDETTAALSTAIGSVNADNIDAVRASPFGAFPLRFWITQGGEQMAGHVGQLEYLQTTWGDLDNHFG